MKITLALIRYLFTRKPTFPKRLFILAVYIQFIWQSKFNIYLVVHAATLKLFEELQRPTSIDSASPFIGRHNIWELQNWNWKTHEFIFTRKPDNPTVSNPGNTSTSYCRHQVLPAYDPIGQGVFYVTRLALRQQRPHCAADIWGILAAS